MISISKSLLQFLPVTKMRFPAASYAMPFSTSVVAPTCAEADALGTMFLAMGADDALAAAKSMPQMKVYFILADGADAYEEYVSPAMEAVIMQ